MSIINQHIDWTRIDTALLDMDGVLLDLYYDDDFWMEHLPARYAAIHDMSRTDARELLLGWYKEQEGTLNWYCVDYWSRRVGFDVTHLKVRRAGKIAMHPLVPEFLTTLAHTGRRRVLVTNAHPKPMRLKLAATGLDRWVDMVVSAFELGLGKEEVAFWDKLHRHVGHNPARSVLIEDSLNNLASARRGGIGQLIQVTHPNSRKPVRDAAEHPAVAGVGDLIPGVLIGAISPPG